METKIGSVPLTSKLLWWKILFGIFGGKFYPYKREEKLQIWFILFLIFSEPKIEWRQLRIVLVSDIFNLISEMRSLYRNGPIRTSKLGVWNIWNTLQNINCEKMCGLALTPSPIKFSKLRNGKSMVVQIIIMFYKCLAQV